MAAGATTGNLSTVTVTPGGGFTGTITLTAAVTASPANAVQAPVVSFGSTGAVARSGMNSGTGTLTIVTQAPTTCTASDQRASSQDGHSGLPLYASGGAALAGIFLLSFSRSKRRRIFALFLLLVASEISVTACGGGAGTPKMTCDTITPGTTSGAYTITVVGTSGTVTSTGTVNLTVQ